MCNVQKSEHIINAPQNKEFLIYLNDLNCQQNSQVFFIKGPSYKVLSMIDSVPLKNEKTPVVGTPFTYVACYYTYVTYITIL